jgi:hypothetical protein
MAGDEDEKEIGEVCAQGAEDFREDALFAGESAATEQHGRTRRHAKLLEQCPKLPGPFTTCRGVVKFAIARDVETRAICAE